MLRARLPVLTCLLVSLAGAGLSASLLQVHVQGRSATGVLFQACRQEGSACDRVIHSRWAVFPPHGSADAGREPSSTDPGGQGIPVAVLGLLYFSALAVWFAAVGMPGLERRRIHRLLILYCATGCLGSLWFVFVMAWHVRAWCPLCLGSHVSNFLLLGALVAYEPRQESRQAAPPPGQARLAAVALCLAAAVGFAEWQGYRALAFAAERDEAAAALEQYVGDGQMIELSYFQQQQEELDLRDDDPMLQAAPGLRMTVVVFSDVECPHCARYHDFLFQDVRPLFDGHLQIVFKHFPLRSLHPHSSRAATALEAARLQDRFGEMYDLLRPRYAHLGAVDYSQLASQLGLDPIRFAADMESEAVHRRVLADLETAVRLGLTTTPSLFLNGRRLDRVMRAQLGFWKLRAQALRRERESKGQSW